MKRFMCSLVLMIFVCLHYRASYAEVRSNGYAGLWSSAIVGHESKEGRGFAGLEVSGYAMLINGSIGYRHSPAESDIKTLTAYVGVGAFNMVQLQVGTAYGSGSVRLRSDLPIPTGKRYEVFPLIGSPMQEVQQIIVSPFLEWGSNRFTYGLGVGYSF